LNEDEMVKKLAKAAHAFSIPIDFEKLISDGLLKKIGRSYYVENINLLPEVVSKRIKTATPSKNGIRITFYKESKSLAKLSEKLKKQI